MQYHDRTSLVKFDEAVMEVVNISDRGLKRVMNSIYYDKPITMHNRSHQEQTVLTQKMIDIDMMHDT